MRQILIALAILLVCASPGASAHSLFNSAEEFLGGYRVQIATLPEFPQIGEDSQVLLRITDADYEEIDGFTVGTRFTYQGDQIFATMPEYIPASHWEDTFVFANSGNHIVYVDLYDMNEPGEVLTYTFNIGTQSPFGYIFIIAITMGAGMLVLVVGYAFFAKRTRH